MRPTPVIVAITLLMNIMAFANSGAVSASEINSDNGLELGVQIGRIFDNSTSVSSVAGLSVTRRNVAGVGLGLELTGNFYEPEISSISDENYEHLSTIGGLTLSRKFGGHRRINYLIEGFAGLSSGNEHLPEDDHCSSCLLPVIEPRITLISSIGKKGAVGVSLLLNVIFADSSTYVQQGIGARYTYRIR